MPIASAPASSRTGAASGRAILETLSGGQTEQQVLAARARGRRRAQCDRLAPAIVGRLAPHHAVLLTEHLTDRDFRDVRDAAIERVSVEIAERRRDEDEVSALLETMPGVSPRPAQILVAELGTDLSRFKSAKQPAAGAGRGLGTAESGGRRVSGQTRQGHAWIRHVLVESAPVAAKTTEASRAAQYRRMASQRGQKRALIAVGHSMLVMIDHILTKREPYQELGGTSFDERDQERVQRRLVHRLEALGDSVTLTASQLAT
jgi:hypothetical protein